MHSIYTKEYRQALSNDFLVIANDMVATPSLVRDKDTWEDFDEQNLEDYFEKSYRIFISRLQEFRGAKHQLTTKEEKELKFMLEALIDIKKSLCETEK